MTFDTELRLIIRIARMYFLEGLTQQEIGGKLGYSRVKINRMLQKARESGIVKITIDAPDSFILDQEDALIQKYNLRDAVIVHTVEQGEPLYLALAESTAQWLKTHMRPGLRVGLGMGRTLSFLPRVFQPIDQKNVTFNEIIGGSSQNSGGLVTYNITSTMASLTRGNAEYIYAPTILSSAESTQALLREPSIAMALENAKKSDIILQSIGPLDTTALLHIHGHLTVEMIEDLRSKGAIGDILGHYIDNEGRLVPNVLENRIIGLSLEDFHLIPFSVIIAFGSAKVPVLRAALKARYANTVITDSQTAELLLED